MSGGLPLKDFGVMDGANLFLRLDEISPGADDDFTDIGGGRQAESGFTGTFLTSLGPGASKCGRSSSSSSSSSGSSAEVINIDAEDIPEVIAESKSEGRFESVSIAGGSRTAPNLL